MRSAQHQIRRSAVRPMGYWDKPNQSRDLGNLQLLSALHLAQSYSLVASTHLSRRVQSHNRVQGSWIQTIQLV